MRRLISTITLTAALTMALPAVALAHVVVTPSTAKVGAETTFSVSVPDEKDVAVTGLKLRIPSDLAEVQPTVHPGWTITTTTDDDKHVTEITWSDGSIPAGQRDDFSFNAQAPANATMLNWKAYQTYADGTTVAWDQAPTSKDVDDDSAASGPYSVTKVVNDLASTNTNASTMTKTSSSSNTLTLTISLIAIILSVVALIRRKD